MSPHPFSSPLVWPFMPFIVGVVVIVSVELSGDTVTERRKKGVDCMYVFIMKGLFRIMNGANGEETKRSKCWLSKQLGRVENFFIINIFIALL